MSFLNETRMAIAEEVQSFLHSSNSRDSCIYIELCASLISLDLAKCVQHQLDLFGFDCQCRLLSNTKGSSVSFVASNGIPIFL